jgi:transmembrane sensor
MKKEELKTLFKKYADGTCSEEEKAQLEAWYLQHNETAESPGRKNIAAAKNLIFLQLPGNDSGMIKMGIRLAAAAVLIGILLTVLFNFIDHGKQRPNTALAKDIPPGTNKAILTLGTGRQINLTNAAKGNLSSQAGMSVTKTQPGQVVFAFSAKNIDHSPSTITTPNGGQWQATLADGTKVWLNAASTIAFPTSFTGLANRIVTLHGEAYFEVAKDAAHPFIVISDHQRIEVLGTHFNINSYPDEPAIKTTLLEGKVKVSLLGSKQTTYLAPGEQSVVTGQQLFKTKADTDEVLAWKDGYFQFDDESVNSVMRKLARWYDIDVKYEGDISAEKLTGRVSQTNPISQVVKALEATKTVHIKMEGRRATIMR